MVDRVRGQRTFVGSRRKYHLIKETVPMRPFLLVVTGMKLDPNQFRAEIF
ncbi:hypothetical protein V5E97_08680 [Singulisphaera sp. Ch08]|uniref:Uncharacterized protein n=1 Tax=Singulisphaera sp. Ch08 TaxID=3120278 RepID=A0AAU7CLK0_9BACT